MPKLLLIPQFPKPPRARKVNEVHLVEVANVLIREMILPVEPKSADVQMAAFVANEFLRVEIQQHHEGAFVSSARLDPARDNARVGGDIKKLKIDPMLGQIGSQAAPSAE